MQRWKVLAGAFFVWFVVLMYLSTSLIQVDTSVAEDEIPLDQLYKELEDLKQQNEQLKSLTSQIENVNHNFIKRGVKELPVDKTRDVVSFIREDNSSVMKLKDKRIPSMQHETIRRKVEDDSQEWWRYMSAQLTKVLHNPNNWKSQIADILKESSNIYKTLSHDLSNLANTDGAQEWRKRESLRLGELIQARILTYQNPSDCDKARKLVCTLNKGCGYGCQLHHAIFCFIMAYATERTFILESTGWRYAKLGWETYFMPLSNTCTKRGPHKGVSWQKSSFDSPVVELSNIGGMQPRPLQLPLAIPRDLASQLMNFHGNPIVWWVGQFMKYLCRPKPHLKKEIDDMAKKLKFRHPIVGIHIRRTDKLGTEAQFHSIDEYMKLADDWFDIHSRGGNTSQRSIYLATDDPSTIGSIKTKYPHYNVLSDRLISESAGLNSRYTDFSLRGIILDIHFLSLTDHLVCTFSSQVCRAAYELMQTRRGDASKSFNSLDDIYYFGGQNGHDVRAIESHVPKSKNEIAIEPGDLIAIHGNHWDGYSKGTNHRTGKQGLFPSYKVVNVIETAPFPIRSQSQKR